MGARWLTQEMKALGYKSYPFPAKYKGGKCGLSGLTIPKGEDVAHFRDKGLCLNAVITRTIYAERDATDPRLTELREQVRTLKEAK